MTDHWMPPLPADDDTGIYSQLLDLMAPPEWHRHAACLGMGNKLFFPVRGLDSVAARKVCDTCPVTEECFEAGKNDRYGVWGGRSRHWRQRNKTGRAA